MCVQRRRRRAVAQCEPARLELVAALLRPHVIEGLLRHAAREPAEEEEVSHVRTDSPQWRASLLELVFTLVLLTRAPAHPRARVPIGVALVRAAAEPAELRGPLLDERHLGGRSGFGRGQVSGEAQCKVRRPVARSDSSVTSWHLRE